ncbi:MULTISPECIES: nuclear transport factor 2 family protein [Nocardiaceae]|jgi:hypothetical protein|uniref:nuclear transport factor 2 family protein n=1 Tax=Nocardiaceae TaxID=85025 RepID=UPI00055A6669|nr:MULTISPECIES: nuclear transport factor 2 family protein [Rhodococcus]OZF03590.1 nuclear transport factor 2 family protein [Rhodococcus sp. 15-1189-1-1a]OZF17395.1 nuclear transport factor 2 family protein [Rhodococcus sp. 14-2686-1-2]
MTFIDRYFELAADSDLEAYFAQFRPDAVVEDEGREHHGIDEIRAWRTEVPDVTYRPRTPTVSGDGHDVKAEIAGDFPGSPVTLRFYFELDEAEKIRVLRIRP